MPDFFARAATQDTLERSLAPPSPPEALDEFDGVLAGVNLQLAVGVAHVGAHGVVAHIELAGNAALAVSLGEEEKHVSLARGQEVLARNLLHVLAAQLARNDLVEISSSRQCSITRTPSTWRNTSLASKNRRLPIRSERKAPAMD